MYIFLHKCNKEGQDKNKLITCKQNILVKIQILVDIVILDLSKFF